MGRLIGAGHAPTAIAIVLDNSLSTSTIVDGAPLFRRLRAAALATARMATQADRIWLVTADGRVVGGSSAAVADAIQRLEPIAGSGDLVAAVGRAVGLVRGAALPRTARSHRNRRPGNLVAPCGAPGDVGVSVARAGGQPAGEPRGRRSGRAADALDSAWQRRGAHDRRRFLRIASPSAAPAQTRARSRGTAVGDGEVVVRAAPAERGWVAGSVELEPDELRGDDVRYFAAWIGTAPAVAIDPSLGPFVRTAADALVQSDRLRLGNGAAVVSADALARLPAFIVAPSDPVRVGAANRALERAGVPWRFGAVRREGGTVREPANVQAKPSTARRSRCDTRSASG